MKVKKREIVIMVLVWPNEVREKVREKEFSVAQTKNERGSIVHNKLELKEEERRTNQGLADVAAGLDGLEEGGVVDELEVGHVKHLHLPVVLHTQEMGVLLGVQCSHSVRIHPLAGENRN